MAAVCSCHSRFFKFLRFVALFAECHGTCNLSCLSSQVLIASVESYFLLLAAVKMLLLRDVTDRQMLKALFDYCSSV